MRPMGPGGFNQRPAPYDRGDRFGGMNRYNNIGRGSRSFKGESVCVSVRVLQSSVIMSCVYVMSILFVKGNLVEFTCFFWQNALIASCCDT
jgi:hypothetical protein